MRVVWNEAKNLANQKKHGISFQEARRLFVSGTDYLEVFDEVHSEFEDRFIAIGPITRGLVLVVWTGPDEGASGSSARASQRDVSSASTSTTCNNCHD